MAKIARSLAGIYAMITGVGKGFVLDPGNDGVVAADPPVQTGDWQFIQPFAFQKFGHFMYDIEPIPPALIQNEQFAVLAGGMSGFLGGGATDGQVVDVMEEADLYYDQSSNVFYNVGE